MQAVPDVLQRISERFFTLKYHVVYLRPVTQPGKNGAATHARILFPLPASAVLPPPPLLNPRCRDIRCSGRYVPRGLPGPAHELDRGSRRERPPSSSALPGYRTHIAD